LSKLDLHFELAATVVIADHGFLDCVVLQLNKSFGARKLNDQDKDLEVSDFIGPLERES